MGMFSNKEYITPEGLEDSLAPLIERIDRLETVVKEQARRLADLELELRQYEERVPQFAPVVSDLSDPATHPSEPSQGVSSVDGSLSVTNANSQTIYLAAPTPDGLFMETSRTEEVGKSIYQLRSEDGMNGQFIMLSTPDAIATAMISISQFVKPACRIEGNTHRQPQSITTLEEGVAQRDGTVWKVVRKARVIFE